jgi:hypothetical protein
MVRESHVILFVLTLQLGVPLVMLLGLALAKPSSKAGLVLNVIAIGGWLLAIALAGMWTIVPWWTPHALAVGLAAVTMWRLRTFRRLPATPSRAGAWVNVIASLVVGSATLLYSAVAISGRSEPDGPIADIANPLPEGTFLVVNGGSARSINAHLMTLSDNAWRGQSHGIDLIRINPWGLPSRGLQPVDPSAYVGFGSPVIAPCNGSIVQAVDGLEDNLVPHTDREHKAGNHVIIRCNGFDLLLAHLRQGSIAVKPGDHVAIGQSIGGIGNSGNSDEPHLHIHAQRDTPPEAPFSADPMPLRINGRFLVRNQRL